MNTIFLNVSKYNTVIFKNVKMLVFDMAGTTINEKGLVYDTLYKTIKKFGLQISKEEMHKWHGSNKYEVLDYFFYKNKPIRNENCEIENAVREQLFSNFNNNLNDIYFTPSDIGLIDDKLPELFENIRRKDIKIALNTGYSKDIQENLIRKFNLNDCIDDYISSQDVSFGRPYPYMIHKLMERNNIMNVNSVLKFGDSRNDVLEGINAGCLSSVGVLSGAGTNKDLKDAKYILNNIMEIE
tara:strand:- start:1110 stop:1829 length:720 start_codon:yes stop_codon:yes gene_type:complete